MLLACLFSSSSFTNKFLIKLTDNHNCDLDKTEEVFTKDDIVKKVSFAYLHNIVSYCVSVE